MGRGKNDAILLDHNSILYGSYSREEVSRQQQNLRRRREAELIQNDQQLFEQLLSSYEDGQIDGAGIPGSKPVKGFASNTVIASSGDMHCTNSSSNKHYQGHIVIAKEMGESPVFAAVATYGPLHRPSSQNNIVATGTDVHQVLTKLNKQLQTKQRPSGRSVYQPIDPSQPGEISWSELVRSAKSLFSA